MEEFNTNVNNSTEAAVNKNKIIALVVGGLLVLTAGLFWLSYSGGKQSGGGPDVPKDYDFRGALQESVGGVDPTPLQDYFAEKVANGENDDETKSAIYWITHRYFDNGGDINEIYDFIQARPAIAFLNEAESIYPTLFAKIKDKSIGKYNSDSLLALLAYYEVIDRYGYGDIALWGMAANQYATLALNAQQLHERREQAGYTYKEGEVQMSDFKEEMTRRAVYFMKRGREFLAANTTETGSLSDLNKLTMIPDDLLVGLNQYAAALENLKGVGWGFGTPYQSGEIYAFNHDLAQSKVPRLYFFTNYLYAASLVAGGNASSETVALPLSRALEYTKTTDRAEWRKSVTRVIEAKTANESGMYAYQIVKTLAALNSDFKNWLMSEGWTQADF